MGKKKVDVLFRVELLFDESAPITKTYLKTFLEDKIKGLKIKTFSALTQDKERFVADISTNLDKILQLEQGPTLTKAMSTIVDHSHLAGELSNNIKVLQTQMKIQKVTNQTLLNSLASLESQSLMMEEVLKKQQMALKTMPAPVAVPANEEESKFLKQVIDELNSELMKLSKENEELKGKGKFGVEIYQDRINKLEEELQKVKENNEAKIKDMEEQKKLYQLQIFERDDRIREIQAAGKDGSRSSTISNEGEDAITQAKLKNYEHKLIGLEEDINTYKNRCWEYEGKNKKLTGDLATSLKELAEYEGSVAAKEYQREKRKSDKMKAEKQIKGIWENISIKLGGTENFAEKEIKKVENSTKGVKKLNLAIQNLKETLGNIQIQCICLSYNNK